MKHKQQRPDGSKRPRRNGERGIARQSYYAKYRAKRFAARFFPSEKE